MTAAPPPTADLPRTADPQPTPGATELKLTVNGDVREVADALTVRGLIVLLELTAGPVAVEVNREVVPRAEHEHRGLRDGDVVEIVHLVGGG